MTKTPEQSDRLLDKSQICKITNVTYPTVWAWMRAGKFPRARIVGGKSMWLSSEVDAWLAELPVRKLKGDLPGPAPRGAAKVRHEQRKEQAARPET